MKLVYPLRARGLSDHHALRMSLRSAQMYATGVTGVVLLTTRPPRWAKGAEVYNKSDAGKKRLATTRKLQAYAERHPDETWVLMCDDFYFCAPTDLHRLPLVYDGDLRDGAEKARALPHKSASIASVWDATAAILEAQGLPTRAFEAHAPLKVRSSLWLASDAPRATHEHLQPQSLYGNFAQDQGGAAMEQQDLKFWGSMIETVDGDVRWDAESADQYIEGRWCFSSSDCAERSSKWRNWMESRYPEPSRWER